jgi:outer membrane protein TolC
MKKQKLFLLLMFSLLLIQVKGQSIITLEQALDMASKGSPSLQSSLFNLERTTESLNAQRAALKSQFSLNVNPMEYSNSRRFDARLSQWFTNESMTSSGTFRVDQPILYTDGKISLINQFGWQSNTSEIQGVTNENKAFFNNLNLSLTQPLFTYNRTKLQIKNLELDNENAMLSYAMQRLTLEKNVSQYFYNVYLAQMSLSIKKEELANTEKSHDIIKNKVEAGLAAREELYQSEVNLASSKSAVESGRVTLENAKDIFKQYIGMDIFEEISVMTDVTVTPIEVDGKKALDHGLASRMELRQRQINVETSQFDLITVRASNEFKGDMVLSMGLSGDDPSMQNIFDKSTKSPRVSLGFNIPIFDWGQRQARIRAQEAVINSQKLNLSNQETQIKIDIRQVVRNLTNLKNQIGIALQNQQNSQLTYDINLERYKNGDLTSMDLNLFQVQLSDKKMAYAQSLINYKVELLNLKIQSLFDFTTNEAVVPEKFVKEYQAGKMK